MGLHLGTHDSSDAIADSRSLIHSYGFTSIYSQLQIHNRGFKIVDSHLWINDYRFIIMDSYLWTRDCGPAVKDSKFRTHASRSTSINPRLRIQN
jgi:hypothetical protein